MSRQDPWLRVGWRSRPGICCLVSIFFLFSGQAVEAVDFLRGDANDDGKVSFADARHTLNFLFLGGQPAPCLNAADKDDSGRLNITDAVGTLNYMVAGGPPPAAPFPSVGPDETPNEDERLDCDAYGNGSALEDPAAAMRIEVTPSAGGDDDRTTMTVYLSSSAPISGYFGAVAVSSDVIYGAGVPIDLTGTQLNGAFILARYDGERLRFGFMPSLVMPATIPAGEDVAVMELSVCLAAGLTAGSFSFDLVAGELVDAATASAIQPTLTGATLVVVSDLDEEAGCRFVPPIDPPDDPSEVEAVYRIGDGAAAPGDSLTLPFLIQSTAEVQGYSCSVDFDETLLQIDDVVRLFEKPDGTDWGFFVVDIDNHDDIPGSSGVEEGFLISAGVMSFLDNENNIPANLENEVLAITLTVREDATPGEITPIRFVDGAQGRGDAVPNVMTSFGMVINPVTAKSFVMITGFLDVVADITFFIRGDANGDETVDLSDAQATLGFLFLGSSQPHCLDAADANDDGDLNVADPVTTLNFLFLGGAPLPPPSGEPGIDPTDDRLRCRERLP